jgi:hypothetical protein
MFATYLRLNVPAHATAKQVLRAAAKKLKPEARRGRAYRNARHGFYGALLDHHANFRKLLMRYRL